MTNQFKTISTWFFGAILLYSIIYNLSILKWLFLIALVVFLISATKKMLRF